MASQIDPASITPAEKNDILWLPPPEVENQLLQSAFNLGSREALVAKALINDGAELSYDEAKWLESLGRHDPFEELSITASLNRLERRLQSPAADRKLVDDAQSAVLTLDEDRARIHARNQWNRLNKEHRRAAEERRAKIRELRKLPRAIWVQQIVDARLPRWGFVILRTAYGPDDDDGGGGGGGGDHHHHHHHHHHHPCSDAAWERFQAYFKNACGYMRTLCKGSSELVRTHASVWVSDRATLDGADTATLRARARAMREAGQIPNGVRVDVFLVVDESVLREEKVASGIVISPHNKKEAVRLRAVDPDHDPSAQPVPAEGPYAGFDGEISVSLHRVFDWLYYTFFAGSETWPLRYSRTKTEAWKAKGKEPETENLRFPWNRMIMPYPSWEW
ncbi:hypothetical protein VTG60DRAFT_3501 [Thermothelomyces hinnuleus]